MKKLIEKGKQSLTGVAQQVADGIASGISLGVSMVQETFNGLPIVSSLERAETGDALEYDEKHYFVVPFSLSPYGFALHTMRCLPPGVLEVNDLPKRRVFHFAHASAEHALREYMVDSAKEIVHERKQAAPNTLESLANDIDALDSKLTYGMFIVGGIAAIFNPVLGIGIAAKAILPSSIGLLSKYGLRPAGEKLTEAQLKAEVRGAEKRIINEFSEASTLKVINPLLLELAFALRTDESEHDPLVDPNLGQGSIPELDNTNWRRLTENAICHVYQDVYDDPEQHAAADLGPEDIRWLKTLFDVHQASSVKPR